MLHRVSDKFCGGIRRHKFNNFIVGHSPLLPVDLEEMNEDVILDDFTTAEQSRYLYKLTKKSSNKIIILYFWVTLNDLESNSDK